MRRTHRSELNEVRPIMENEEREAIKKKTWGKAPGSDEIVSEKIKLAWRKKIILQEWKSAKDVYDLILENAVQEALN